ncbi:diguanylate cyclase [Marinomonas sp. C2222]|uniref:diguanylate cyclase n=1 Tax=Marinomonas sargassi TaxID=2984494 RepID=A0ABT2YSU1_9GAMM|nr:diguanylate cyclase [Marinomonas sargassi]MCV2402957.1 diguanylate cyclase [Marinomonas sargassi]
MFQQDVNQANSLMKAAIPLMAKLDIPPTPFNYGVWFEYVSNRTPKLNASVDKALRKFGGLPAFVSQDIFNEFILTEDFQCAQSQGPTLKKLTHDLANETDQVNDELKNFKRTLSKATKAINKANDVAHIEKLTSLLEQRTFQVNQIVEQFSETLIAAQEEIDLLKAELSDAKLNTELDQLTSLMNRKGLERALFSLAPYSEDDLSLLFVDIDNLKKINEENSKAICTSLIRYFAKLLSSHTPEGSHLARLNGGQFAILLSETELSLASQFAENLRKKVSVQKIRNKNTKTILDSVTVSIGVATLFGNESPSDLIKRSEDFLVHAKKSGKNCVVHRK